MRDIKFRAWNTGVKQMLHFNTPIGIMDGEDRYGMFLSSAEGKMFIGGEYIMMQYTGLLDKNGKEIYEGDIFRMKDPDFRYTVAWHDTGFTGKQQGCFGSYIGLKHWLDVIEVVGNIHEGEVE